MEVGQQNPLGALRRGARQCCTARNRREHHYFHRVGNEHHSLQPPWQTFGGFFHNIVTQNELDEGLNSLVKALVSMGEAWKTRGQCPNVSGWRGAWRAVAMLGHASPSS